MTHKRTALGLTTSRPEIESYADPAIGAVSNSYRPTAKIKPTTPVTASYYY